MAQRRMSGWRVENRNSGSRKKSYEQAASDSSAESGIKARNHQHIK